ncbi:acyl-CoA dehydrogenase family protein [Brevundimonas vesicularis]|uniref:acyl-CoA dehydrogenase family protein n=1 Tax=Brevundimonas vesicularis TaxID=41276 RepID=UPI0038D3759F
MAASATPDLEAFRREVRDWLSANLPPHLAEVGRKATSVFTDLKPSLEWQAILHGQGWVAPGWPAEYGGPGWDEGRQHVFATECARAHAPHLAPMGLKMVGPCIMRFGTPEQKTHYLPRILSGQDYWCQGYSESGAGSDLASLSLNAQRDGDDYVLNGSKIWTTHAHFANRMFCLVRTRKEGRPQTGITFLLLDMDSPGIRVDPIITLAGDHELNQVFFDDVRVPVSGRLGEENEGWTVAKYLLEFERSSAYAASLRITLGELRQMLANEPDGQGNTLIDHAEWRAELAEAEAMVDAIEAAEDGVQAIIAAGGNPGAGASMLKVQGTEAQQKLQKMAVLIAGPYAAVDDAQSRLPGGSPGVAPDLSLLAMARYLNGRALSIFGGANEIQRGILARSQGL